MGTDTPHRRAVRPARGCCSTTSSSCSPRSPTRRSTPSARSWSPRLGGDHRPRGQPARARRRRRAARSQLPLPILDNDELAKLDPHRRRGRLPASGAVVDPGLYPVAEGGDGLRRGARRRPPPRLSEAIAEGANILVLSDRRLDPRAGADPVAAAHRGGAPPPDPREDPHPGRPGRRGRRRPRGAPHGAAARATAPRPSTRTWRSRPIEDMIAPGRAHRHRPRRGGRQLHQGRRARAC